MCSVVIKVGMLGDSQIGKTSLMVKYVEGHFDEDYIQTLGPSSLPFFLIPLRSLSLFLTMISTDLTRTFLRSLSCSSRLTSSIAMMGCGCVLDTQE